jgi:hypothetical protein
MFFLITNKFSFTFISMVIKHQHLVCQEALEESPNLLLATTARCVFLKVTTIIRTKKAIITFFLLSRPFPCNPIQSIRHPVGRTRRTTFSKAEKITIEKKYFSLPIRL